MCIRDRITAGQGTVQESSAEVPGGGSETVHFYGPGGQNAGDSTTPNTVQNEQAPAPESEGSASSPVITAGEADSPGQVQQSLSDPAAGGEQGGTESPVSYTHLGGIVYYRKASLKIG